MSDLANPIGLSESNANINRGKLNVEQAVRERYSAASKAAQPSLCCPTSYDSQYLDVLPDELIERDYGCGDPSRFLKDGDTVLDLGSGGGKICYIASQVVGSSGRVIGVDMNDDMLCLARKYQGEIGERIGYHNVEFRKGRIQDLGLDMDEFEQYLASHPVESADDWLKATQVAGRMREEQPLIPDESIDVIVSNCVLNLVGLENREQLFSEMFRVLRRGGRVVISDIVSDEEVPERLRDDPQLWSGCISGAFTEHEFLSTFQNVGFYGVEILERQEQAWATIEGIEFRSMTVRAFKGKEGPCLDHKQAVIYKGPWKAVVDDDGHTLFRGRPMAVCEKTMQIYSNAPYVEHVIPLHPRVPVVPEAAAEFDCETDAVRNFKEMKGVAFDKTSLPGDGCCDDGGCC